MSGFCGYGNKCDLPDGQCVKGDCDMCPRLTDLAGCFDDDLDGDEDVEFEFDCHLDPRSGQCGKAGSEECDWECPNRNSEFYAGSTAWRAKHRRPPKRGQNEP